MPITYSRSDDGYFSSWADRADASILFFDPVLERYSHNPVAESLGDRVRALDPGVRSVDFIILRGRDRSFAEIAESDPVLRTAVGDTPAVALIAEESPEWKMTYLPLRGLVEPECYPPVELIRQTELEALCRRNAALFQNQHFHYQLPNRLHADGFIRLGDALHDPVDVARIADWICPHLKRDGLLLADTGSILALVQELSRRLNLPFECLAKYPSDRVTVERRIEDLRRHGRREGPLNVLVSVTSSGRLLKLVHDVTGGAAGMISVFDTRKPEDGTPGIILARVPIDRWEPNDKGECKVCPHRQIMPIAEHSYECSPGLNWKSKPLVFKDAEADRPFWEVVDATRAVTLHVSKPYFRDGQQRSRHFGVYLDVERLLSHTGFASECRGVLEKKIAPPDVVLIPRHSCAQPVENLIRSVYSSATICQLESARLDDRALAHVRCARHVLIADDAIVSGGTLGGLRISVYRATQDLAEPPTIQAFVVVARPDRGSDLRAVVRPYRDRQGDQLFYGKMVYLPERCPWCEEKAVLTQVFEHLSAPSQIVANLRIQQFDAPLKFPFLLGVQAGQIIAPVTRRSFFGELGHETAFASCASTAQRMRNDFVTYRHGGVIEVFDVPMIVESYFETVFPSAVLRTATRSQLWNPNTHDQLGRHIERMDIEKAYPGSISELGLAAAVDKVPRDAVMKLLERAQEIKSDRCLEMLIELIKVNGG